MKRANAMTLAATLAICGCTVHNLKAEPETVAEEPNNEDCSIPGSFTPITTASVPFVEGTKPGIEVQNNNIQIELGEDGNVSWKIKTQLFHRGSISAIAKVGYLTRVPEGLRPSIQGLAFGNQSEKIQRKTCSFDSPRNLIRPYTDTADYVTVQVKPGATVEIELSYSTKARMSHKPATLFGYHDVFALNWKNWDWPYTKSPIFEEISESMKLFSGSLDLGRASNTIVKVRATPPGSQIRGLSCEQKTTEIENKKAFAWAFNQKDQPPKIEFEYIEGANFEKEMDVFSRISETRPNDLRARIHLSNLYFLNGDSESRVKILKNLLENWEEHAPIQLLTKRNDVRPAAYVGLVRSLEALGKNSKAKQEASKGVSLISKLMSEYGESMPEFAQSTRIFLEEHMKQ